MCRLFGLCAPKPILATFWLLGASDSILKQSHSNADGTGLGYFNADGEAVLEKEALAAFQDGAYAREARSARARMFVSHIRFATNGAKKRENCHPFEMDGRLFAHNGVVGGTDQLEARLGDVASLVQGDTDSERYFALITKRIREHDGDVRAGIVSAVRFIAETLPVGSLNFVLATPDQLWAFRYPETDELHFLQREGGGSARGSRELHYMSRHGLRVVAQELSQTPSVIVASEPLDDHPGWQPFQSGELICVSTRDLSIERTRILDREPVQVL